MRGGKNIAASVLLLAAHAGAHAADSIIYDDASQNGFNPGCTFGAAPDFANGTFVHSGSKAIRFVASGFGAVSWCTPSTLNTTTYSGLRLFVHGGNVGAQNLQLVFGLQGNVVASASLSSLLGSAIPATSYAAINATFDSGPLAFAGNFDQISIQDNNDQPPQPAVYFDDVTLIGRSTVVDTIFRNGFESSVLPPGGILIEQNVVVDTMSSERYTWHDAGDQLRSATFPHNDVVGPGGTRGGYLRRYSYVTPGGTRNVGPSFQDVIGGFGYVVSHPEDSAAADQLGQDNSPFGSQFPGNWTRTFEGRHHVILRFTQTYPRYFLDGGGAAHTYQMPLTIEWLVATGHNHPLWTITYKLDGAGAPPVNTLIDDSRAPYGDLQFDGGDGEGSPTSNIIQGVSWGDRYKFVTTSAPMTLSSSWTWTALNTVPFNYLWTQNVDAEMGLVQSQDYIGQDAGGYQAFGRWNTTSGAGNACPQPAHPGEVHSLPCIDEWPYQMNQFAFLIPPTYVNVCPNCTTDSKRIAWGSNYGFLGQTSTPYHFCANGSCALTGSGYPYRSYSIYVVLDRHGQTPTLNQVAQVERTMIASLSASLGTVAVNGPAGINRPDTLAYQPAGYNRIYGTWEAIANANDATLNFNAGASGIDRPIFVLRSYTSANPPTSVTFDGAPLVADVDYFASVDSASQKLWITINRLWTGTHTLAVSSP